MGEKIQNDSRTRGKAKFTHCLYLFPDRWGRIQELCSWNEEIPFQVLHGQSCRAEWDRNLVTGLVQSMVCFEHVSNFQKTFS